jgi:hypothetical protein
MAAKTRCPACGAKSPVANHRCRICTAIINPGAAAAVEEEPVAPAALDHFDPSQIDRQVRPAREHFGSSGGALAARLAAAQGDAPRPGTSSPDAPRPDGVVARPSPGAAPRPEIDVGPMAAVDDPAASIDPLAATPVPPPAPPAVAPLEYEAEPFDPDALFRDMA